jgi:hypothetical protein
LPPEIAKKAAAGQIVYDLNFNISVGTTDWNIDLVIGLAPLGMTPPEPPLKIIHTHPASVQVAIEIKSVMTEHRKAIKNRKRDFEAHHMHAHQYNSKIIAGGVLVLNASTTFKSPLRPEVTTHKNPHNLISHCINEMKSVGSSGGIIGEQGLDAKAVIVVNSDNLNLSDTSYVISKPAPPMGDPVHYDAFIQKICELYGMRFA